eukprot:1173093-Rhodomonas_salina.1
MTGAKQFFDLSTFTVFEFVGHSQEHDKRKSMYSSASWTLCRVGNVVSFRPEPCYSEPRAVPCSGSKSVIFGRARAGFIPVAAGRPHAFPTVVQRQQFIVVDPKPSDSVRSSAVTAFRSAARQSALKTLLPGVRWSADAFSPTLA